MDDSFEKLIKDERPEETYAPMQNPNRIEYDPDGPDQFEPYEPEFVSNSVEYVPTYVPSSSYPEENSSTLLESDCAIDLSFVATDNYNDSGDSNDSYDVLALHSDKVLFAKPDLPEKVIKEEPFLACEQNDMPEYIHFDNPKKTSRNLNEEGSAAVAELLDFMPKKVKPKGGFFDQHEGPPDDDHIQILEERVLANKQERMDKRREEKKCSMRALFGVGDLISELRGSKKAVKEEPGVCFRSSRMVLDFNGRILPNDGSCRRADGMKEPLWLPLQDLIKLEMEKRPIKSCILEQIFDLPPTPEHPKRVEDIRKLVRSKMPRCKVCKCRFGERVLLEFHLKKAHPEEYLEFILEQEKDAQAQKEHEIQQNRLEELYCGGFIPPEEDYMAENVKHEVTEIPLPGEMSANGRPAHVIDRWGTISQPRFKFKKKVSPQCPLCDKRFRNDISLKKHLYKKHPEIEYMDQCLKCFKITVCDEEKQNHDCDMTFLCFECNPIRNMCTAVRLANHRGKFHRGANSGFRCNECNQKFLTPRKLRKHKK